MSMVQAFSASLSKIDASRQRWPRGRFIAFTVAAVLALTVFAFSPRWWLMAEPTPGSFQWSRGLGFIAQCEDPFRNDVEPALRWRLLPPLVAHYTGLRGTTAFIIPWAGILAFLIATASVSCRLLPQRTAALFLTTLVATSSAILVPLHWLGVNDAWVWLGLLTVACARAPFSLIAAALLCPWIDERFLIGLPLALACRDQLLPPGHRRNWLSIIACCLPYIATRITAFAITTQGSPDHSFLHHTLTEFHVWLPLAPLGWWMAFRSGWMIIALAFLTRSVRAHLIAGAAIAISTLALSTILAADLSRSAAIVFPVLFLGAVTLASRWPARAPLVLGVCALANLILPVAHVVYRSVDRVDSLPVELYRLLR